MRDARYYNYMKSKMWLYKKIQYYKSGLPQKCTACGNPKFDLHHRTYKNFTKENLEDLVPLCRKHHQELHRTKPASRSIERHTELFLSRSFSPWKKPRKRKKTT